MKTIALKIKKSDQIELENWLNKRTIQSGQARIAQLLLLLQQGMTYAEICDRLGCSMGYISRWKGRYIEQGLSGLSTRHEGRKASTQAVKLEAKILSHTQKQPMDGSTHWSTRKMAKALGIDHMTEVRTWQKHGIKPHLSQSYMHSDDPDFEAKAVDIIGLYPILLNMQSCLASMRRVPSRHWIERTPSSPCHQEEWKDMGLNITAMVRCRSIPPLILRMGQFMVKLPNGIPVRNSCLSFRGKTDSTTRTGNSYYLRQLVSP